jgi:predicted Zn-dependent protease
MRSLFIALAAGSSFAISFHNVNGQGVGASRGLPASGSYTVTGKVRLPDGNPAEGARVDVSCDFTSQTSTTDSDGTYRVTGMPAGNCSNIARVAGLSPVTENRQITRDTPFGQAIYIPIYFRANGNAANSNASSTNPVFKGVPKEAVEHYRSAVEKIEKGDMNGALPLLEKSIAAHPPFAAAWYQKGFVLGKLNEKQKAVEAFVKAIELKPDYLEAKYGFGMAQLDLKNYEVSEAVFRDIIKEKSDMPEAHLNLGISLFYLKKTDEAETELKAVLADDGGKKLALAHLYLGQIYIQRNDHAEAAAELQKYLDLVPKAPNAERIRKEISELKKRS